MPQAPAGSSWLQGKGRRRQLLSGRRAAGLSGSQAPAHWPRRPHSPLLTTGAVLKGADGRVQLLDGRNDARVHRHRVGRVRAAEEDGLRLGDLLSGKIDLQRAEVPEREGMPGLGSASKRRAAVQLQKTLHLAQRLLWQERDTAGPPQPSRQPSQLAPVKPRSNPWSNPWSTPLTCWRSRPGRPGQTWACTCRRRCRPWW